VINRVVPAYPQTARSLNSIGIVKLDVLVQSNGSVKSMQVKGGSPMRSQNRRSPRFTVESGKRLTTRPWNWWNFTSTRKYRAWARVLLRGWDVAGVCYFYNAPSKSESPRIIHETK